MESFIQFSHFSTVLFHRIVSILVVVTGRVLIRLLRRFKIPFFRFYLHSLISCRIFWLFREALGHIQFHTFFSFFLLRLSFKLLQLWLHIPHVYTFFHELYNVFENRFQVFYRIIVIDRRLNEFFSSDVF